MKKKLRSIVVNGKLFQWTADWTYFEGLRMLHLRVWGGPKTSCCLHVNLHSKWFAPCTDSSYPTPKDVQNIINFALGQGWETYAQKQDYWLTEDQNELQLADLLITDYGRLATAHHPLTRMQRYG